jgi:putative SOS response-associated peptidase YedK
MCGRFTLTIDPNTLMSVLDLNSVPVELEPRYNIAPSQSIAVVTDEEKRDVELMKWGLIPSWAKDPAIANQLINARSETIAEKPSFRAAFAKRRCLVLADGFYEWERQEGKKKKGEPPNYFRLKDGDPIAIAGLWEVWYPSPNTDPLLTCTLITTTAIDVVAPIHDRSPVILTGERMWAWLDPSATPAQLQDLLRLLPDDQLTTYRVSPSVNSPRNDGASLIQPA